MALGSKDGRLCLLNVGFDVEPNVAMKKSDAKKFEVMKTSEAIHGSD